MIIGIVYVAALPSEQSRVPAGHGRMDGDSSPDCGDYMRRIGWMAQLIAAGLG